MVTILEYILLGIILYIMVIPVLEQLAALICQGLELIKGVFIYYQTKLQNKIDNMKPKEEEQPILTQAIGFEIPAVEEEEYND